MIKALLMLFISFIVICLVVGGLTCLLLLIDRLVDRWSHK